jgi:anthranilate phosphoribosyltransferase
MMQRYLKIVGNGQRTARDLTPDEAEAALTLIMDGEASLPQVAAFMAALRIKEESIEELAIFAKVLRRYCQTTIVESPYLVDICVPYDGRMKHLSVIPAAALIAASAGAKVALHGRIGQNTPPKFGVGVGDILGVLGVPVKHSVSEAAALLSDDTIGVAYIDVTQFAPALERFASVRFDYGMRSYFNTIEKLINPFGAPNVIVGVFHAPVLERVAKAAQALGYQRGVAVQGSEGAIDILPSRRTPIIEFGASGTFESLTIDPDTYGWSDRSDAPSVAVTVETNAELTRNLLRPTDAPLNNLQKAMLLTAALIVYASGRQPTFGDAVKAVQAIYGSDEIVQRLARWQTQLQQET